MGVMKTMPNRIIKESICTSENLDSLSPEEEIFFYRLMVNCDDFGTMDARLPILRAKLFPLKLNKISEKNIKNYLDSLIKAKLIFIYEKDGCLYLKMTKWESHQQVRAQRSKYPQPTENDISGNQMISYDCICPRESNPIQSNKNPNPNPNATSKDVALEPKIIFISIPLNDGTDYDVTETFVEEMQSLYQAVDVKQAIRELKAWNVTNKKKRKTLSGIERHINSWLAKEQDGYHKPANQQQSNPAAIQEADMNYDADSNLPGNFKFS